MIKVQSCYRYTDSLRRILHNVFLLYVTHCVLYAVCGGGGVWWCVVVCVAVCGGGAWWCIVSYSGGI